MKTRLLRSVALIVTACLACACEGDATSESASQRFGSDRAVEIIPHTIAYRADRTRVEAVGTARARRSATIFADTGGEVTAVRFEAGDRVAAGDTLLELDARTQRLDVERARVAVREAELLLERYTQLEAPSAISRSQVDDARIVLESARIDLQLAEVALADRTVRAPFDGFVGLTDIDPGTRITPQTEITQLDDRGILFVDFQAPEQVFGRMNAGDTLSMSPFSDPATTYEADLARVDSRVDTGSRTFTVRARLDNPDDVLRPGMSFRVNVELPGQRYPAVPEAAIVWGGDGAYLWAVRDGQAQRVPLTIVSRQQGLVLVRAELPEGSTIVAEGVQKMREGAEVTTRLAGGGTGRGEITPGAASR